jgi:Ni,Fe-hydrogenase I large subunit
MAQVKIAPMNRMEGHHDVDCQTDGNKVVTSVDNKAVMFRGLENIMVKRDPRDAPIITQRSCGVCPITHGGAASKATGEAFGFKVDYNHFNDDPNYPKHSNMTTDVPNNGRLLRNLAMASNYLQSHILHFYHLVALDYVDVNGTGLIPKGFLCPNYDSTYYARGIDPVLQTGGLGGPAYTVNYMGPAAAGNPYGWNLGVGYGDLTPYFAGQYVRALKFRRMCHQVGAIFAGKMPHASCYTPGCMTTRPYDPTATSGRDYEVRKKFEELMWGGPNWDPNTGGPFSPSSPHQESLLGFIGKPSDFWSWGANGFVPTDLPVWAQLGVPGAGTGPSGAKGSSYTGTFCFDTVAAAHVFPEYFWFGSGYGRYLSWGVFEDASAEHASEWGAGLLPHPDQRLNVRGRVHIPRNDNGSGTPYNYAYHTAKHYEPSPAVGQPKDIVQEYTKHSWFDDTPITKGRHPWKGKTKGNPNKPGGYSFAKSPRYYNNESAGWQTTWHPNGDWLPYEVGPLARMLANANFLTNPGGPATPTEVLAMDAGSRMAYYPGILSDVDLTLPTLPAFAALGPQGIGVMPNNTNRAPLAFTGTTNLATHLNTLVGAGVHYLQPGYVPLPANWVNFHGDYMGGATLDRIAARTIETYYVARNMLSWFNAIDASKPVNTTKAFTWGGRTTRCAPAKSTGAGLTEAPRGALAHWIVVGGKRAWKFGSPAEQLKYKRYRGKVRKYQIITPTAWNISPKDHNDAMGPQERCTWGTPLIDEKEPIEILRVIHSFDNCLACTVHVMNVKGEKVAEALVESSG